MEKNLIETLDAGRTGEEEACRFLKKQNYRIIERNYRVPSGEIDIVAGRKNVIVFAEVKTRRHTDYAMPWESVGYRKRNRLKAAARIYIREHALPCDMDFRFDVISIVLDEALKPHVEWLQNAF